MSSVSSSMGVTKRCTVMLYLEHLVPSWDFLFFLIKGKKPTCALLHWSSSSMLGSWLCCCESFPRLCLSACCFYFLGKLGFVLVNENTLQWSLWIVLRDKWRAWWRENVSHFLPNETRVRSERNPFSPSPCPKCLTSNLRQFQALTTVNYSNGQIELQLLFWV